MPGTRVRPFGRPGMNLVPGIHVFLPWWRCKQDVDGRDDPRNRCGDCSPGHDERKVIRMIA
jgi:hypothetical protein